MLEDVFRLSAALTLLVLPGAWLAFGIARVDGGTPLRLALAVALSPGVVLTEFHLLRWAGVPFGPTSVGILVVNLPALLLIWKMSPRISLPSARTVAFWGVPALLVAGYLVPWLYDPGVRANWRHNWLHADIAYMIANGQLRPEEPQLAGMRLAYPWLGDAFQAVVSYVRGTSPNSSFVLTKWTWLVAVIALGVEVVRQLGGRLAARISLVGLLCFGVNFLGSVLWDVVPPEIAAEYPVWGDGRYTPWIRKFGTFESTAFGIGLFAALTAVLTRDDDATPMASRLALVAALLLSAALLYPLLWPACAAVVGAYLLGNVDRWRGRGFRELLWLLTILLVTSVVLFGYVRFVTIDRGPLAAMGLTSPYGLRLKVATAAIVLAPLWIGAVFALPGLAREHRRALVVLGVSLMATLVLFLTLDIYFESNEYKFVFLAAICLAPMAALACGRLADRLGRSGPLVPLALAGLLAYPALSDAPREDGGYEIRPEVDVTQFDFRLIAPEPYARALDAIRTSTPLATVLVARALPFDLVTPTRRPIYVPFVGGQALRGLGLRPDYLLELVRGYPEALVEGRRETVQQLYEAPQPDARQVALRRMLMDVDRPLAFLTELPRDVALAAWLAGSGATSIYAGAGLSAWLVLPAAVSSVGPVRP